MKKLLLPLIFLITVLLNACQNKAGNYIQQKIDDRKENRINKEKYTEESKGTTVWWNNKYDSRNVNHHLNSDQFGSR